MHFSCVEAHGGYNKIGEIQSQSCHNESTNILNGRNIDFDIIILKEKSVDYILKYLLFNLVIYLSSINFLL